MKKLTPLLLALSLLCTSAAAAKPDYPDSAALRTSGAVLRLPDAGERSFEYSFAEQSEIWSDFLIISDEIAAEVVVEITSESPDHTISLQLFSYDVESLAVTAAGDPFSISVQSGYKTSTSLSGMAGLMYEAGKYYCIKVIPDGADEVFGTITVRYTGNLENRYITRGEFAARLAEYVEDGFIPDEPMFFDVPKYSPYYDAIGRLYSVGIAKGRGNGLFEPESYMLLDEAWNMTARLYEPDEIFSLGDWPEFGIWLAIRHGISTSGHPGDLLTLRQANELLNCLTEDNWHPVPYGMIPDITSVCDYASGFAGDHEYYFSFKTSGVQYSDAMMCPKDNDVDIDIQFTTNQPGFNIYLRVFRVYDEAEPEGVAITEPVILAVSPEGVSSITLTQLLGGPVEVDALYYLEIKSDDVNAGGIVTEVPVW